MKTTRLFLTLAMALLLASNVSAKPVDRAQAAKVAQTYWTSVLHGKNDTPLVLQSEGWPYEAIYLFVYPSGGFILVSADNAARPILGYSLSGILVADRMPAPLRQWLDGYQEQLEALREDEVVPYAADSEAWQMLLNGIPTKDIDSTSLAPLLTTQWDQQYPYNLLCPEGSVTGCAATAQAQFLKFWNHPAFGNGSHSYNHWSYGLQQADFGHTLYDWQHMPDQPNELSSPEEMDAVATLMYHCGVSIDMNYGTAEAGGSSALGLIGIEGYASIDNALKNFFLYSPSMRVAFKDYDYFTGVSYSNDEWRQLLIDELSQGHPILYAGAATQGGHGFLCDGYDERQYLHFNFGWSGIGDGYYTVDSISPGHGGVGGNVTYTFNLQNAALLGAVPLYAMRVSDTLFNFPRSGGSDSLLFCVNDALDTPWSVVSSADWISLDSATFQRAGWIRFHASPCSDGAERYATLTFSQGGESISVRVVQSAYNPEELCPLTVVMQSTRGEGWQGNAYLTLQSAASYIFGTASLSSGTLDSVVINVAPHDVYSVFHSGGGTDRYINYWIRNQHGETVVSAEYAYHNGGTHFVEWPCDHLGIDSVASWSVEPSVFPNPTQGVLYIDAAGTPTVEIIDATGRPLLRSVGTAIDLSPLAPGLYFVRIVTSDATAIRRIVKQ